LTLIAPQGGIPKSPGKLAWNPVAGAAEYTIIVEGIEPTWTASTRDTSIGVPADIASRFVPGKSYSWRVKAYTAQGLLLAASAKTAFQVNR
jgi:hypothetical protein